MSTRRTSARWGDLLGFRDDAGSARVAFRDFVGAGHGQVSDTWPWDNVTRPSPPWSNRERGRRAGRAGRSPSRSRRKDVRRVVGDPDRLLLVRERSQRGDGAEDLLARDAVVVRILDERAGVPTSSSPTLAW